MFIISPEILQRMICPGEYKSFFADMLPSLSARTRSNLKNVKKPSQKTINTIIKDLSAFSSSDEKTVEDLLRSPDVQPWKSTLEGMKKGMGLYHPDSFNYSMELIIQIESAFFNALIENQNGVSHWWECFQATGLPTTIMPDSFLETFVHTLNLKKENKRNLFVPADSGKVLLRTNLFVLAALETSLVNSDMVPSGTVMAFHEKIPFYRKGNLVEPMKIFFKSIMKKKNIPTIAKFAELVPPLTLPKHESDKDNQRRQVYRWISGKSFPCWETMRSLSNTFFDGDDGLMVSYGVSRFLQSLLIDLRENCIPTFFSDEHQIISIFQEYPNWQAYHMKNFITWNQVRGQASPSLEQKL